MENPGRHVYSFLKAIGSGAMTPQFKKTLGVLILVGTGICFVGDFGLFPGWGRSTRAPTEREFGDVKISPGGRFRLWLAGAPPEAKARSAASGSSSNIERRDYLGDNSSCKTCHQKSYELWERSTHRKMNARADDSTVKGDFSGTQEIRFDGGTGRFFRSGTEFRMVAARGTVSRDFLVTRTIGSRFYQYYVGIQLTGPEPAKDLRYSLEHVLPFGYWIDRKEWVPLVHIGMIGGELPDSLRKDVYEKFPLLPYDVACAACHTTRVAGDQFIRGPQPTAEAASVTFGMDVPLYLKRNHEGLWKIAAERNVTDAPSMSILARQLATNEWKMPAIALEITCEGCHLGLKAHGEDPKRKPAYFPQGPTLLAELPGEAPYGRSSANVNFLCGRCHNSSRHCFPGGSTVWNSAEYRDGIRSKCYRKASCVDCHGAHGSIGPRWQKAPEQDDAACLRCHAPLGEKQARAAHTHHAAGSTGDRCMNCHMPRVNEGLQDAVRTHLIASPTLKAEIEGNGPNACNICHLDRSITWTTDALKSWYKKSYDPAAMASSYKDQDQPMLAEWLGHTFPSTRLVAIAAMGREQKSWMLPYLVEALDDPVMINRQFARMSFEGWTRKSLKDLGYWYHDGRAQRARVLPAIAAAIGVLPGNRVSLTITEVTDPAFFPLRKVD